MQNNNNPSLDAIFDSSALSAREQVTQWVKIKDQLGTRVGGKFLGYWVVPAEGVYREQIGVALQDVNNSEVVYGINLPSYFESDILEYLVGDLCGFEYYKDIPAKKVGLSPTKAVRAYNPSLKERKVQGGSLVPSEVEKGSQGANIASESVSGGAVGNDLGDNSDEPSSDDLPF